MGLQKIFTPVIIFIFLILCYRTILGFSLFSGGDYFFPYITNPENQVSAWSVWSPMAGGGMGSNALQSVNFDIYSQWIPSVFLSLGIPAVIVQKFFFVIPIFVLSSIGIQKLSKRFSVSFWISYLVYMTNTYILMIIHGGQFGIALAYAAVPLAFSLFFDSDTPIKAIMYSWILGLLILFDIRISVIFFLLCIFWQRKYMLYGYVIPWSLALLYHSYLWYPVVFGGVRPVAEAGSSLTGALAPAFYSFADFVHSFSLLHPNWPENIFGKTYFMKPEFLVIPFVAFAALRKNRIIHIRHLALIALLGGFLSKGVNEPFGFVYQWMFENIPGFSLFRDPTKFYVLGALSYSILIAAMVKKKILVFLIVWFFLMRSAVFQPLGPLHIREVPQEYRQLSEMISADSRFYRTLWVGNTDVFTPKTLAHPAVPLSDLSGLYDLDQSIVWLSERYRDTEIRELGVGYVIVPLDIQGKIFVTDRKFDVNVRSAVLEDLDDIPWLVRLPEYKDLAVFRVSGNRPLIHSDKKELDYTVQHPYQIFADTGHLKAGDRIVFNQAFDPRWELWQGDEKVSPEKNVLGQMVFTLPKSSQPSEFYYAPQSFFQSGLKLSAIYIMLSIGLYFFIRKKLV